MAFRTCSTDRGLWRVSNTVTGCSRARRRGFSMAEALTASVVLAVAVVGIAGPLTAASEQAELAQETANAVVLAKELMEEIASKPLLDGGSTCHLGPEVTGGETTRGRYDSADDYHGYTDNTSCLDSLSGTRMTLPTGYRRSVSVEYRATPSGAAAASGEFGLVTVTVLTPNKQSIKLSRLLCKERVTTAS